MPNDIGQNRIFGITPRRSAKRAASTLAATSTKQKNAMSAEQVARRAYEIWQAKGCPHGQDVENWLQAERELNQQSSA